jgi:hypothetical protein
MRIFPFLKTRTSRLAPREGQIMMITVVVLGTTLLSATVVAGLLLILQIREGGNLASSARAFYAADAGIEWGLYAFTKGTTLTTPVFTNGAQSSVTCYDAANAVTDCNTSSTKAIRAVGSSGNASRALEAAF